MIELTTMVAAIVAAITGTFLTAAVARNLWAERRQRQLLARMAAEQAAEPGTAPVPRRQRRAAARAAAKR